MACIYIYTKKKNWALLGGLDGRSHSLMNDQGRNKKIISLYFNRYERNAFFIAPQIMGGIRLS